MKTLKIKNSNEEIPVGKLVCVGRNYAEHAKELGNEVPEFPLIFLKPASALIFSEEDIIHPDYSTEMHHEVELVLVIGETIKNADDETAETAIIGYAVGLDMTLRDIQSKLKQKGHPWTIAKCFDNSAVLSDVILKPDYELNGNEKILLWVNDQIKQDSTLKNMIFSPVEVVKYVSSMMTLERGDLIYTGTPEGVSKVVRGDIIKAAISDVGELLTRIK
jgi:5-carboxymethyl-2-hydroxymuconate isomerase